MAKSNNFEIRVFIVNFAVKTVISKLFDFALASNEIKHYRWNEIDIYMKEKIKQSTQIDFFGGIDQCARIDTQP